ncbi:MAG: hypothetical protein HZB80_06995 [Deltaproteobacteria bacterium]|nr:hypothetical protein [Deltaproteobacteria bacterium]
MVFILSKIILFILLPPASLILMMAYGIIFLKRHPRFAGVLMIAGFALLYLLSIRPAADAATG